MTDEFEELRERSMRNSSVYEDLDVETSSSGGFLSQFTPIQRLILAVLLLIDIIVVIYVILSITGIL